MGKFSFDKDFAKRVSMHRDPEQHKKRDDNKKRGDNPNARRNKYMASASSRAASPCAI